MTMILFHILYKWATTFLEAAWRLDIFNFILCILLSFSYKHLF